MKTCENCTSKNDIDAAFCDSCGSMLPKSEKVSDLNVEDTNNLENVENSNYAQVALDKSEQSFSVPMFGANANQQEPQMLQGQEGQFMQQAQQSPQPFTAAQGQSQFNASVENPIVIGVRSANVLFQLIFQAIISIPSIALTIWFFSYDPTLAIIFLIIDLTTLPLWIYFLYVMIKTPKQRIIYDGSSITLFTSRKTSVQIIPNEISFVIGTAGNWFLNGMLFLSDGTVTIESKKGTFKLRLIRQSQTAGQEIETLRSAYAFNRPFN